MRTTNKRRGPAAAVVCALGLGLASTTRAQEGPAGQSLEAQVQALRAEMQQLRNELDDTGWQLQVRGGWFHLAHNHRNAVFNQDDHQHGWTVGLGLIAPIWRDVGADEGEDGIVDLLAHLSLQYRQLAYSPSFTAPITSARGTINYLNIVVAPQIRVEVTEVVRPYVLVGMNMQVKSPPQDPITYLDLGLVAGLGIDFRVHRRVSVGVEYRYTWFGVADQEEEDYGLLLGYLGFNF